MPWYLSLKVTDYGINSAAGSEYRVEGPRSCPTYPRLQPAVCPSPSDVTLFLSPFLIGQEDAQPAQSTERQWWEGTDFLSMTAAETRSKI